MLPERREETSVNGEVVKPACDDMAAVIETPRHSKMSILKRQAWAPMMALAGLAEGLEFSSHHLHGGS